jgi:uncharacterized protein with FMN-binding domain
MRRFVTVFVATATGLVVLLGFKTAPAKAPRPAALSGVTPGETSAPPDSSPPVSSAPASAAPSSAEAPASSVPPSAKASPTPTKYTAKTTPKPTPKPSSTTKTVTGSTVSVSEGRRVFGVVQVRLTLTNGKITAVSAVQAPEGDPHSAQISQFSIPILGQEVLSAQSASIAAVSGATYTSDAYAQSVQAALDAAKA